MSGKILDDRVARKSQQKLKYIASTKNEIYRINKSRAEQSFESKNIEGKKKLRMQNEAFGSFESKMKLLKALKAK